jgi:DNA-binding LacI/PurR family transcriptional regulator
VPPTEWQGRHLDTLSVQMSTDDAPPAASPVAGSHARAAPRSTRVRLEDVAREAEVSKSLCSRVLNHYPDLKIRPEVRQRILDAAARLKYRPHAAARGLRRADSGIVGLLIPDLTNAFFAPIIRGAFARAMQRDFVVLVAEDKAVAETSEMVNRLVQSARLDGMIVASARPRHPLISMLRARNIPHVFVNRGVRGSNRNVLLDDARASRAALDHLIGLGHTRIGHVGGPSELDSAKRLAAGFRAIASERGLEPLIVEGELTENGGGEAANELLQRYPDITALFATSLVQAVGILQLAYRRGLDVPRDLSIVAYDEVPLAAFLHPPLTTVEMPTDQLGTAAVDALIDQILGEPMASLMLDSEPTIVIRESTAAVRAARGRRAS